MAQTTDIGWVRNSDGSKGATVNFWHGCTKVSPACDNCYAAGWAARFKTVAWGAGKPRHARLETAAAEAFRLQRRAARLGIRIRVFSNSLSDFFDAEVPDAWRDYALAVIALTPDLDWLVLTKRAKVMREYFLHDDGFGRWGYIEGMAFHLCEKVPGAPKPPRGKTLANWGGRNLPNLWLGVTAEDQKRADLRIPELLATPAARRFVSCEPLLGPVHLAPWLSTPSGFQRALRRASSDLFCTDREAETAYDQFMRARRTGVGVVLDLAIAGGESGGGARPSHPDWFRKLRDDCVGAEVPFFFKQWGEWAPVSHLPMGEAHRGRCCTLKRDGTRRGNQAGDQVWGQRMIRVGKKSAGNALDGVTWEQLPGEGATASTAQSAGVTGPAPRTAP